MRKLFLLLLIQMSFLGAVIAQTGTSFYLQDFTELIGQSLVDYTDGSGATWDTTGASATTNVHWRVFAATVNGDNGTSKTNVLYMNDDTNIDNMQDEVISVNIELPRENDIAGVATAYYLNFDWWSDQDNLGGGTDPELDPDAAITIEARFHNGSSWLATWTEIWSEDDQARLEETTISGPYGDFDWSTYSSYAEGWNKTEIDLTDIAGHQPDSIMLRLTYTGVNADEFYLDNLEIRYESIDEYEVDIRMTEDYSYIPWLFAKDMSMDFIATVTKNTDSTFDEANARVELYLESSLAGFVVMKNTDFSTSNVIEYSFSNMVAEFPVEDDTYYTYSARERASNTWSNTDFMYLSDFNFTRDNTTSLTTYLNGDLSTPGIGVLYELTNPELLDRVYLYFNTTGVNFSYDIIKVSGSDATSGELIFSSGTEVTATNFTGNFDDILLEAGFYIIMVNQLTSTNIDLKQDTQNDGFYYRGNVDAFTKVEDEGWPMIRMYMRSNRNPAFVGGTDYDHQLTEGQQFSYVVSVGDDDEDLVGSRRIDPDETWLQASWLTITDNGDNTFTFTGTPTESGSYEFDMKVGDPEGDSVTQTFSFDIFDPYALDFEENFNVNGLPWSNNVGWTTISDAAGYGSTSTWDHTFEYDSYADDEFKGDNYIATMLGENSVVQEEWLISPGIDIPALDVGTDSSVHLEFVYRIDWKFFVGPDMGNLNDGYNAGDISLLITDDGGATWSDPIWKEDDADIMLATTISDDKGTTDDDDDIYISSDDWPAYSNGSYNLSQNEYFMSRIDISSYEGQTIWLAFKYESDSSNNAAGADFRLDYVDVNLIVPAVELETMPQNTTSFRMIPYFQAQDVSMMAKITNLDRHDITGGVLEAMVVDKNTETVYFENTTFNLNGEDTTSVTLGTLFTPMVNSDNVSNTHVFSFTSKYNNEDFSYPSDADNFSITYTDNEYAVDNNSYNHTLLCEEGEFVGLKFDIFKEDNLRWFKLYVNTYSHGSEYLSFTLVKNGEVIYNSPSYRAGFDFGTGWETFNIDDFKIQPGTYYLMVKTEVSVGVMKLGVDSDADGFYYRGLPGNIAVDTEDTGNLMLRMSVGNDAPSFLPSITNQDATVGDAFAFNVSAKDTNSDSLTFAMELAPDWLTFLNIDDGNRAVFSGTPGGDDIGSNLIQLAVYDDRDTVRELFTIDVQESPAPIFTTAPVVLANEGVAYSYNAIGSDVIGDDVTVSAELLPSWLTATVSANGDEILLTGTPGVANVGEHRVKLNVTDEFGMTSQQAFEIFVKANVAPMFITFGSIVANEDVAYLYNVVASDENNDDILAITSSTLPAWLTLTDNGDGTAVLTGAPTNTDVGPDEITLIVTDNLGLSDSQTFTILITPVNDAPTFTSSQVDVQVEAGYLFSYTIEVTDIDSDNIMFNTDMPEWLLLTNQGDGTALLRGMPMLDALGLNPVTIIAADGQAEVLQTFTIDVIYTTSAPLVAVLNSVKATVNNPFEFTLDAIDFDGDKINFNVEELPGWLNLSNDEGSAVFTGTPLEKETYSFEINVSDVLHTVVSTLNIEVSESLAVGVENVSRDIKIYPNPTSNFINITNAEGSMLYVYNIIGEKVLEIGEIESSRTQIDLSTLRIGTYILKIYQDEEIILRKINIIQ